MGVLDFLARKACHLAEYFILMAMVYRAVQGGQKIREGHLLACFAFALLFAVTDEWHQTFVFGRNGSPFDVFVDAAGALAGYIYIFHKDQKNHEEKTQNQNPAKLEN